VAWLTVLPVWAKKPAQPQPVPLTTEQEQQFTYYWYAARQAIEEERFPEAYALLQFCDAIKPNDAQTLYYIGVMYQVLGKQQEYIATLEQAYRVSGDKKSEDLLDHLLRIYISKAEWKQALRMQDELDRVRRYDAYSAMTRYRIYAMAGEPKKAIKAIDKYLKTDPTNLRFLLFRVELTEQTGARTKELYALYKRVLELDPYNIYVLNNYAYHLATHGGNLKEAERMSAITIREDPGNPVYMDTYGWIMHLQGQDELALFYFNRALWNTRDEKVKNEIEKHIRLLKSEK